MSEDNAMPHKRLPRITKVAAGDQPYTLHITWDNGDESLVDVSQLITTFRLYAPLRENLRRFSKCRWASTGPILYGRMRSIWLLTRSGACPWNSPGSR